MSALLEKNEYLKVWYEAVEHLLHWDRTRFKSWLQYTSYARALANTNSMIYHEEPTYWLTGLFIAPDTAGVLSKLKRVELQKQLANALNGLTDDVLNAQVNWAEYRTRIDEIIRDYERPTGTKLSLEDDQSLHPVGVSVFKIDGEAWVRPIATDERSPAGEMPYVMDNGVVVPVATAIVNPGSDYVSSRKYDLPKDPRLFHPNRPSVAAR